VRSDRVHHLGALANKEIPRLVVQKCRLSFGRLHGHKPHGRSGDRFADRLGIGRIGLATLHVGRRHDPHLVSKFSQLARPVMRASAGFQTDEARLQTLEKVEDLVPPKLALQGRRAVRINAMHLKHRLGKIEADGERLFHGWLLSSGTSRCLSFWHIAMPGAGAIHPINGATMASPLRSISLAWRSPLFSCSRTLMRSRSSVVTPSRRPLAFSACLTHSRKVWEIQPILGAMLAPACVS
jgi:hypothetical protein